MCLYLSLLTWVKRPKKVYKVLCKDLSSPCKYFDYEIGKKYHISPEDICNDIRLYTNKIKYARFSTGIHCFKTKKESLHYFDPFTYGIFIFEAIIPKGAYIVEQDNCIVTTDIMIKPYHYVPYNIFGKTFFIRKRYKK